MTGHAKFGVTRGVRGVTALANDRNRRQISESLLQSGAKRGVFRWLGPRDPVEPEWADAVLGLPGMNPDLSVSEVDALLDILHRGVVLIRHAAAARDAERAEAIADAIHNVPRLLKEGNRWGWTIAYLRTLFLEPLADRYPDLAGLHQPLEALR